MFFKGNYHVKDVFDDYNKNMIIKTLQEKGVNLDLEQGLSEEWAGYSVNHALEKGLDIFRAMSFSSLVSGIITGLPTSASTEYYFKEDNIFDEALKFINEKNNDNIDEKDIIREVFLYLFKLYDEDIRKYEYLTKKVSIRLSERQLHILSDVDGETTSDKLSYLIDHF